MKNLTEAMARWIAQLKYEDLPPNVVAKTKELLLDTVGCALGALAGEPVRLARQVVREQGGAPQSTPIGISWKTSCDQAAFLNGMAIRYYDFNDYAISGGHPSINVAPALAVAEAQGLSGKDLLLGIVAGYQVQLCMRDATAKGKQESWDQSTLVHYSSAALAGRLLGLAPDKLAHALAIAGSHACTLAQVRRGRLSMWKGAADPIGARNGTFAALLARSGLTGPLAIIDGKYGYGEVVAGALDEKLLRRRARNFQVLQCCIKPWPCLFVAQSPVAAAVGIRRQGVAPAKIKKITVFLNAFGYKQQMRFLESGVSTREDADHSVPYCVTRALQDGDLRLDHFAAGAFTSPEARSWLRKITLRYDRKLTPKVGARVEVQLEDGKVLREQVLYPPGHLRNPLSRDQLLKKFLMLAEKSLGEQRALKAAEMILNVEEVSAVASLSDALRAAPALT